MKYHVKLKKNLEKRGARHLEKRRVCQEDSNNKKIEISTWPQERPKRQGIFPAISDKIP